MIHVQSESLRTHLRMRDPKAHKNDFGHLLIVAGSFGMAGAAQFAAASALRSGAGLVTVACPASIVPILQITQPGAMCIPLPEEDGAISKEAVPILENALRGKTALAIGCGLSMRANPDIVRTVLSTSLPAVIDADALNLCAKYSTLSALFSSRHVITPHPGEASRLLGRPASSCMEDARALHSMGPVSLLKGADSFICGEDEYISSSGTVGMAKGGSGDVLTGIVGSLLAQGYSPTDAAWMASEIHGLAGEAAARRLGTIAMTPMDTVDSLSEVFMAYAP